MNVAMHHIENTTIDGVIAAWQFENNVLDSVGSNDGTLYNGSYVSGVVDDCINLTSTTSSRVEVSGTNFNFSDGVTDSSFSISAWFKINATGSWAVVSKRTTNANKCWDLFNDSNKLAFSVYNNSGVAFQALYYHTLTTNTWYYVTATYDGTTLKLYVDSTLEADNAVKGSYDVMRSNSSPVKLSGIASNPSYSGKVHLDEVFIFNKALSQDEINFIYDEQLAGNDILA